MEDRGIDKLARILIIIVSVIVLKWILMTGIFVWSQKYGNTEVTTVNHPVFKNYP